MDQWWVTLLVSLGEQVGIPVLIALVMSNLQHNPADMATFKSSLLLLADTIYTTFGIIPPSHTTVVNQKNKRT